jgi:HD-like signal output (HDOD) protein
MNLDSKSAAIATLTRQPALEEWRMTLIWIGVALLVAAISAVLLRKTATRTTPTGRAAGRVHEPRQERAPVPAAAHPPPVADPAPKPAAEPSTAPAVLTHFSLQRAADLPEERRQAYVTAFKDIPRPPKLLHRLLSPDFVNEASSTQLVDLIVGEPLIASKVLTTINSPMYGLKAPVSSIGQAVTYLGLNTVRGLCLQYILIASFKADSAERKLRLDTAWNASALASELTQQLSQRLGFDDRGSLVSSVVLSFLGRLATTASMSPEQLAAIPAHGLLDRAIAEQKTLGLCASQIGRLLMNDWGLPETIANDAAEIDAVLLTPSSGFDAERGSRLALCYLCARLGERLAEGTLSDLYTFDLHPESDAEMYHLQGYLAHPKLARLVQVVQSQEVGSGLRQMLSAMRA